MRRSDRHRWGSSPVTCGDWLFDNRLGLASGLRVKISQPIAETGSKWESYSKFKLGGMLSKVPKHIRSAGDPSRLAFTLNYPPFGARRGIEAQTDCPLPSPSAVARCRRPVPSPSAVARYRCPAPSPSAAPAERSPVGCITSGG